MTTTTTSSNGFTLKQLCLTGKGAPKAEITFELGLNVVVGPSDTGKTFITQCIDFMLGASTPPKSIPEVDGYDTAYLELETATGETLVLQRSLSGGAFLLSRGGETFTLKEVHEAENEDTVSHFFLSLTGFSGQKVRTNARGGTRTVSFRDIAHLIVVGEEDVITERSPILSGQYTSKTAETSVFRLLLTGHDDSSLIEQDETKVAKGKQEGKKELLEELLAKNKSEIAELKPEDITPESLDGVLGETEAAIEELNNALTAERASASNLESERKSAWQSLRQVESRAAVSVELQHRFELLQEQYASDLRRLEAIGEAGVRLAQMTEERCPVCGAIAEHHDEKHRLAYAQPEDVAVACGAEAEKLQLLVRELSVTISSNNQELNGLETKAESYRVKLNAAQQTLHEEMQPRVAMLVDRLRMMDQRRGRLESLATLFRRRDELLSMLEEADKPIPRLAKLP